MERDRGRGALAGAGGAARIKEGISRPACTEVPKTGGAGYLAGSVPGLVRPGMRCFSHFSRVFEGKFALWRCIRHCIGAGASDYLYLSGAGGECFPRPAHDQPGAPGISARFIVRTALVCFIPTLKGGVAQWLRKCCWRPTGQEALYSLWYPINGKLPAIHPTVGAQGVMKIPRRGLLVRYVSQS